MKNNATKETIQSAIGTDTLYSEIIAHSRHG